MKFHSSILAAGCIASALATYSTNCTAQSRLFGTFFGGEKVERGGKVATDAAGNIYIVGTTESVTGIATPDGFDPLLNKPAKGFLAKFKTTGQLIWATYYGDGADEFGGLSSEIKDLGLDSSGNIYILGNVDCPSLSLATAGAHQTACQGGDDMFIAKFTPAGKRTWGTYFGGDGDETGEALSVMPTGEVYLIGTTTSKQGFIPPTSVDPIHGGTATNDAVVAKFDSSGKRLWSRYFGGEWHDYGYDIACRRFLLFDACYITGYTGSVSQIATAGAHDGTLGDTADGFVARVSGTNGQTLWSTYYGGGDVDYGKSVVVDSARNVYVTGFARSSDGIATSNTHDMSYNGIGDIYLAKFDANGNRKAGTYFGNSHGEHPLDLAIDGSNNIYVFGRADESGGHTTPGAFDTTLGGGTDAVLAKFNSALDLVWGTYYGGSGYEMLLIGIGNGGVAVDSANHVYVTGDTMSTDALSTPGSHKPHVFNTKGDVFLAEFSQLSPPN